MKRMLVYYIADFSVSMTKRLVSLLDSERIILHVLNFPFLEVKIVLVTEAVVSKDLEVQ